MLVALLLVPAHFELESILRAHCTLAGDVNHNLLGWDVQILRKRCEIGEASFGFATTLQHSRCLGFGHKKII